MSAVTRSFSDLAGAAVAAYIGRDPSFASRVGFWIEHFGAKPIGEITGDDIDEGVDVLLKRKKVLVRTTAAGVVRATSDKPLSGSTINRYVASLGSVFRDLRRMRLLPRGFVSPMPGVRREPEGESRTVSVTTADVHRLIACCRVSRNRRLAALVAMAVTTGWRKASLQGLRWGSVDLQTGFADTPRTKNGTPHRTPLMPWVVAELKRIRPAKVSDNDLIFGCTNFTRAWENSLARADLPTDWTFHHCRHIAASLLAQSGAQTITIMQALNHKTPLMAMRYSHLNVDSLRESIAKVWA